MLTPTGRLSKNPDQICPECGKIFCKPKQLYCSHICFERAAANKHRSICLGCGKEFQVILSRKAQKYCSRECFFETYRDMVHTQKCLKCGKEFKVGRKRVGIAKYCSKVCYWADNKKSIIEKPKQFSTPIKYGRWGSSSRISYCEQCGIIFKYRGKGSSRFCGSLCSQQYQIENSVRAPRNRNRRKSKDTEFSRNRLLVFARDKYRCQYCGRGIKNETSYGEQVVLHADHIVPKSEGGSNELNNLVTACQECNYAKATLKILPSCVPKDEKESLQLSLLDTVH